MNIALFYDTETTGLPLYDQPSDDPRQPHIVQLGAILVDLDARKEIACLDLIVIKFYFGFSMGVSVAQIICIGIAIFLYNRSRIR